jgi:hypothetical protein
MSQWSVDPDMDPVEFGLIQDMMRDEQGCLGPLACICECHDMEAEDLYGFECNCPASEKYRLEYHEEGE